ncbi:MAG: RNA polymerase sigma-70 factor [Bacteroidota bacterium]
MVIKPILNEQELLAKIAMNDQRAFKVIYEQYRKLVYSSALKLLRDESQAEEIVQEVFMKLWIMGEELTKVRHLESYLTTIVRNRSLNVLRRIALAAKADRGLVLTWEEEHNETEERIMLNDCHRILEEGIQQLSPKQKEVYQLCYGQGMKYQQVADLLGISALTVKTHMQLALRSLRKHVQANGNFAIFLLLLKII